MSMETAFFSKKQAHFEYLFNNKYNTYATYKGFIRFG